MSSRDVTPNEGGKKGFGIVTFEDVRQLEAALRLGDRSRFRFLRGGSFASKHEAGTRSVILHVIRQVVRTGQRLAGHFNRAAGEPGRDERGGQCAAASPSVGP